ncbi:MAG TPA: helix-hairpin-helix domain-containing protein [Pseudogracilibacillus sp.]|nr:helix-hairpin-helix domain-containing protein [Pseudogracilibacillus sp.]
MKKFAPLAMIAAIGVFIYFLLQKDEVNETVVELGPFEDEFLKDDPASLALSNDDLAGEEVASVILVDIKGEVHNPGVYEVEVDERMQTIIELAGGFTANADERQINLAQKVHDEMVIYVPKEGEEELPALASGTSMLASNSASYNSAAEGDLIKVNQATVDDLTKLNGIGPSKAQAIIDHRDEHGLFEKVEDLLEVSGIGEKTLENIKDQLLVP